MKRKFRCFLALCLILSLLSLLAGCGGSEQATKPGTGDSRSGKKGQLVIGVTNMTMKESVYHFMKAAAEKKAKELGVKLIWQSSENDPQKQLSQVENFIAMGVDAIVIEPARSDAAVPMVKRAKDAGIPVVNLEARIKGIKTDLRIGADCVRIGEMQVEDFVKSYGDKPANVVILSGTKGDETAEDITKGNLNAIKRHPNIKVVMQQYHLEWDRQLAMNTMQNALVKTNKNIQAVFANNDTMAHGAMKAAEEAGVRDKIMFYGADNDKDSVEEILKGPP